MDPRTEQPTNGENDVPSHVERVERDGEVTMTNQQTGYSRSEPGEVADWLESLPLDTLK
ncbi:hypothetical protein LWC34_38935 [Kibdelosporangium philippinense]|uniref:Uncharacterized protein n=1 Tax=Kibdelosporangium philippinense TaxID=211113 RepID=A0ABS8ZLT7_9PSEU|nr:hypothetical protein [Kibdelosporangium philippinense]MCE7008746.1 hypothetical protein [Kibdelosporangium philippinense]